MSLYNFPFQISNTYLYTYRELYSCKVDAILIVSVKVVNQIVSENKKVKEKWSLGVYVFIFIHNFLIIFRYCLVKNHSNDEVFICGKEFVNQLNSILNENSSVIQEFKGKFSNQFHQEFV